MALFSGCAFEGAELMVDFLFIATLQRQKNTFSSLRFFLLKTGNSRLTARAYNHGTTGCHLSKTKSPRAANASPCGAHTKGRRNLVHVGRMPAGQGTVCRRAARLPARGSTAYRLGSHVPASGEALARGLQRPQRWELRAVVRCKPLRRIEPAQRAAVAGPIFLTRHCMPTAHPMPDADAVPSPAFRPAFAKTGGNGRLGATQAHQTEKGFPGATRKAFFEIVLFRGRIFFTKHVSCQNLP